eukprot:XP_002261109.1 hypothetical protein, conserved in Plasmodium species [Plasmodium knowlesi strain H]
MEEPIKILYLHIYEDTKTKKIRKLLEENYGKDNILYRRCLGKANKLFDTLKPNVIVGYQFGCILAMHLSGVRIPMVLVSPVQENIFSSKIRKTVNIGDYPYIIFVHSTKDTKRNLSKTLELVESINRQNCRVEIVEEGHNFELMSASDYKNWVDEVYAQGQDVGKNAAPSSTTVEESIRELPLFLLLPPFAPLCSFENVYRLFAPLRVGIAKAKTRENRKMATWRKNGQRRETIP